MIVAVMAVAGAGMIVAGFWLAVGLWASLMAAGVALVVGAWVAEQVLEA